MKGSIKKTITGLVAALVVSFSIGVGFSGWLIVRSPIVASFLNLNSDSLLAAVIEEDKSGDHPTGFSVFTLSNYGYVSNGKFTQNAPLTSYMVFYPKIARDFSFVDSSTGSVSLSFRLTLSNSSLAPSAIISDNISSISVSGLSVSGEASSLYDDGVLLHSFDYVVPNANDPVRFSLSFTFNASFITALGSNIPSFVFSAEVLHP